MRCTSPAASSTVTSPPANTMIQLVGRSAKHDCETPVSLLPMYPIPFYLPQTSIGRTSGKCPSSIPESDDILGVGVSPYQRTFSRGDSSLIAPCKLNSPAAKTSFCSAGYRCNSHTVAGSSTSRLNRILVPAIPRNLTVVLRLRAEPAVFTNRKPATSAPKFCTG